jgi:hypothetical protein
MPDPVCVVGDSHVRSFSRSTAFLPIFIGPGRSVGFIDEATARDTADRLHVIVGRLPKPWPVVFALGEPDVRRCLDGAAGTDSTGAARRAAVETAAWRYLEALDRLDAAGRRFAIYNLVPCADAERNALAAAYNEVLRAGAETRGHAYIDVWPEVVDRATGAARPDFVGDPIHLNERAAPLAAAALRAGGLWPSGAPYRDDFSWSYLYRFEVGDHQMRVWGGATKGTRAERYGPADRVAVAMAVIDRALSWAGVREIAVLTCREGHAAFALKPRPGRSILARDVAAQRIEAARRIAAIVRRPDIAFETASDGPGAPVTAVPEPGDVAPDAWPGLARRLAAEGSHALVVRSPDAACRVAVATAFPGVLDVRLADCWGDGGGTLTAGLARGAGGFGWALRTAALLDRLIRPLKTPRRT